MSARRKVPDEVLAEDGLPVRMRGFHLGDADVDELAARAAALRTDRWLSTEEKRP